MIGLWVSKVQAGKTPSLKPITVTTDLGKMFRGLEVSFCNLFNLPDFELYGKAIDGIAVGGMIGGGFIAARSDCREVAREICTTAISGFKACKPA